VFTALGFEQPVRISARELAVAIEPTIFVQFEERPFPGFAPWTARRKAKNSNIEKRFLLIPRSSRATCWRNRFAEHHLQEEVMADQSGDPRVHNLTPEDVARGLTEGRMLLVDVREQNEVDVESYPDAAVVPLSSFDPAAIPDPQGRQVVFACRSGRRSVTASLAAQERGYPYDSHLAGGILAWKAAGLPTES
jgi:rhodanese-related sulfurtransferase